MEFLKDHPIIRRAGALWEAGTSAVFLSAIGDGNLPTEAFDRWLVQDYHFAKGFTAFLALLLSKAPREDHAPIIAGIQAMDAEMSWFESHHAKRRLDLNESVHPVCQRYIDFMIRVGYTGPYSGMLAVLFGIEAAYCMAWGRLKSQGPYKEFIERWTNPRFVKYVKALGSLAEKYPDSSQQDYFNQVLVHEREFWRMTYSGGSSPESASR